MAAKRATWSGVTSYLSIWLLVMPTLAVGAEAAVSSGSLAAGYLSQLVGGLVLVILAIVVLAWFLRRLPGVAIPGREVIQILAVRSIGARERLMLVQVGEEQLLIGVSATGMRHLHTLKKAVEVPPHEPWPSDFASLFNRVKSSGTGS